MLKVYLNNDQTTNLDLSDFILDVGNLHRRIESDKPGEPGLIVFDNVNFEFPLSAFSTENGGHDDFSPGNLDSYGNYLFTIKWDNGSEELLLFEGMLDKGSVVYTKTETVKFDVLDKLSALSLIDLGNARPKIYFEYDRLGEGSVEDYLYEFIHPSGEWYEAIRFKDDETTYTDAQLLIYPGDIIAKNDELCLVKDAYLNQFEDNGQYYDEIIVEYWSDVPAHETVDNFPLYEKYFYGVDIGTYVSGVLEHYDGIKIIEAIVKQVWPEINIINNTGSEHFLISLDYYKDLIDNKPFDKKPLEALKFLAKSMEIYLFINKNGDLVLQKNDQLGTYGDPFNIDQNYESADYEKHYQWDKKIDYVLVKNANDSADYGEYPQSPNFIPRNKLELEVFDFNNNLNEIAQNYYNLYGKRRQSAQLKIKLDENGMRLDMLQKVVFDAIDWFIVNLTIDLKQMNLELNIVEI